MIYNIIIALLFAVLFVLVVIVPIVECKGKLSEYMKAIAAARIDLESAEAAYLAALNDDAGSDVGGEGSLRRKESTLSEYTKAKHALKAQVGDYNEMIEEFPNNLFAKMFGYKRLDD